MRANTHTQNNDQLPASLPASLPAGMFSYQPHALDEVKAQRLFAHLRDTLPWQQPSILVYGKWHAIPRLQLYMGDADSAYEYSQQRFEPAPWVPELDAMRQRLNGALGCHFNAVLINYYRHGLDCMGWHSDDEPELGPDPVIASISLGALRKFKLRHKASGEVTDLALTNGSLLIMKGQSQHCYAHSLPKQRKVTQGRINLTFRHIDSSLL
ncbi:alpha-ketoglutarate-dependent dioxygenase AlkB family protein [Pseudoalteromonas sp. T1lg22]|uniref:alpha-ketoglutarate-dependent dioxygenase AlkB family protein n=1 Tax=Pseudoalteromonas sp. T1lg22 TaxID=2077096 RepID=UPI000CF6F694|nr:alpha-ketoglutarate-dependent dioxygenase AlkB [Pseudoalteromonas sp. T1lg22]